LGTVFAVKNKQNTLKKRFCYGKCWVFGQALITQINQYFIKSQINDWSLQSYADNFASIILEKSKSSTDEIFEYPLSEIEEKINEKKQRNIVISEESFKNYRWFSLKVLTPNRVYQFEPDIRGRFNPEIDHIFPLKLKDSSEEYKRRVDALWNLQPTKGNINGYKTNHHPKSFFSDQLKDSNNKEIVGSKYLTDYDFLFPKEENGKICLTDPIWDKPYDFIERRKELMLEFMKSYYGIEISGNNKWK